MKLKSILKVFVLVAINIPLFSQTTFTESAATFGINASGYKDGGHAWGDYDNDGDLDLLVASATTGATNGSKLYRNNGNGTFTNVTATLAPDLDNNLRERQAVWGDLNNDGFPDFMVNTAYDGLDVYLQDPNTGMFGDGIGGTQPYRIDNAGTIGNNNDQYWTVENWVNSEGAGFFDFEGDGDLDIFFDNHDYGVEIMRNNQINHVTHQEVDPPHGALFTHITTPANTDGAGLSFGINQNSTDGDYSAVADVNDDGWVDLFNRKRDENDFFLNQGGYFINGEDLGQAYNSNKGGNGLWDIDNDGDLDAVWTDNDGNKIYRNDGPGIWTLLPINTLSIGNNTDIDGVAGGDIDNDGDIDLIFSGNNRSYLYINNLNSPVGNINIGAPFSFTLDAETFNSGKDGEGVTMVDVDDDGDLDIYFNIKNGNNQLYINNLSGVSKQNHLFVHVAEDRAADGTISGHPNRSALGANVVIKDCEGNVVSGIRDIGGAFGHGNQIADYAHFGLPLGEDELYIIEVHYPNRYDDDTGQIERLVATAVVTPSDIVGTNHYFMTTDLAESLENPNAPVAVNDEVLACANNNINVTFNVLTNDSDADGDDLIINSIITNPVIGTATIVDADLGTINFTYNGAAPFTDVIIEYEVGDGGGAAAACSAAGKIDTGFFTILLDADCDNVANVTDLDDDNDGITDFEEGFCPLTNEFSGTFGTLNPQTRRDLENNSNLAFYNYLPSGQNILAGEYAVISTNILPDWHNAALPNFFGHTTGDANDAFLIVNGATNVGVFYEEAIAVPFNQDFDFGCWAANWTGVDADPDIIVRVLDENGVEITTASTGRIAAIDGWVQAIGTVNTGLNHFLTLRIENLTIDASGNDFAIDDVFFGVPCKMVH